MTFSNFVEILKRQGILGKICIVYGNQIGVDDYVVSKIKAALEELRIAFEVCHYSNLSNYNLSQADSLVFVLSATPYNDSISMCYFFM